MSEKDSSLSNLKISAIEQKEQHRMDERLTAASFLQSRMKLKLDTLSLEESNEFMDIKWCSRA